MNEFNQIEFIKSKLKKQYKILHSYEGKFEKSIISKYRKKLLELTKENKPAQRKIFYVFVELTQNVAYYSNIRDKETNIGKGTLLIGENSDSYFFVVGINIEKNEINVLKKKCEIINSLNRDSLRKFKRQQRNLIPGTNGGAHIGLIMVALTTRKKLFIDISEFDKNSSYFFLKVEIDKKIKKFTK